MITTAGHALRRAFACLAFLLALAPSAAWAARLPYAVRAWTIADGLPTSTVQDIAQTPDGYLWLSTTGGLARFDGVRFAVYGLADGLSSNPPAAPAALPASSDGASKVDTAFARRIREVVAARMGDEDFGVDELAEAMGRTLLFQRTRDLLAETPMELLVGRRLERAAELLAAAEGNVGEVAYAVGFRSVAHFTHRFRERFAVTPSAWRRGSRTE